MRLKCVGVASEVNIKILVVGAGITGSGLAVRQHDPGNDVTLLARGKRLAELRENGVRIAIGSSPVVRTVRISVVDRPATGDAVGDHTGVGDEHGTTFGTTYDLIAVCVRTHHVDAVLESLIGVPGDVLFLLNWAAGPAPLAAVLGDDRVLLGFATEAGTWDGDVVRLRAASVATQLVSTAPDLAGRARAARQTPSCSLDCDPRPVAVKSAPRGPGSPL